MEIRLLAASALKNDMLVFKVVPSDEHQSGRMDAEFTYEQENLFSLF
jgi:hypothetical protein